MARPRFSHPIVNIPLRTDAVVHVYQPGTTTPITGRIYADRDGTTILSQGFPASSGYASFYLDNAQPVTVGITPEGGSQILLDDVEVGAVVQWRRTVKDYGALGDGTTDDAGAIQAAFDDMASGSSLYVPDGTYLIGTVLQWPTVNGVTIEGPKGSQGRLGPAVFKAKSGAALPAIAAPRDWLTNNGAGSDSDGFCLRGVGFDGGHYRTGDGNRDNPPESGADTEIGIVLHGNWMTVEDVFVLSTNGVGFECAGVGMDGTTALSTSHENRLTGIGTHYTGGDAIHGGVGFEDSWLINIRPSLAGGCCVNLEDGAGWSIGGESHPTMAGQDIIRILLAWQTRIIGNYIGGIGYYQDGTGWYGSRKWGVNVKGSAIITGNMLNGFPGVEQVDPFGAIRLETGYFNVRDNQFRHSGTEDTVNVETHSIQGASAVADNIDIAS